MSIEVGEERRWVAGHDDAVALAHHVGSRLSGDRVCAYEHQGKRRIGVVGRQVEGRERQRVADVNVPEVALFGVAVRLPEGILDDVVVGGAVEVPTAVALHALLDEGRFAGQLDGIVSTGQIPGVVEVLLGLASPAREELVLLESFEPLGFFGGQHPGNTSVRFESAFGLIFVGGGAAVPEEQGVRALTLDETVSEGDVGDALDVAEDADLLDRPVGLVETVGVAGARENGSPLFPVDDDHVAGQVEPDHDSGVVTQLAEVRTGRIATRDSIVAVQGVEDRVVGPVLDQPLDEVVRDAKLLAVTVDVAGGAGNVMRALRLVEEPTADHLRWGVGVSV